MGLPALENSAGLVYNRTDAKIKIRIFMKNRLRPCVDCGKELSPTATSCNQCQSSDPFGNKRRKMRNSNIFMIIVFAVLLIYLCATGTLSGILAEFSRLYDEFTQGS